MHEKSSDTTTSLEQALIVLRRRWKILLASIIVVGAAATALSMSQQKQYTATAALLFRQTDFNQQLFGADFTPLQYDPTQEQATDFDLASLPVVAERTGAALNLPAGLVASEVSVSGVGQANIATVSATDPSPDQAARIANTYAHQFVLSRQQADRQQIAAAQALVQKQITALTPAQRASSTGTTLQNRSNELGVLAALQTGNAQVAQTASPPSSPSAPRTKRNAALGLLVGLLLGLLLVFVVERLDKRIRSASELEDLYGIPVLGVVPDSKAYETAGRVRLPAREAEAFALLRARLRYFNVDHDVRSLLLTSSAPGEGKTTVALNLAIAEAMAGTTRVVLLEADLRRPTLANRLDIHPRPGLSELLSRNAGLESALRVVMVPGARDNMVETCFSVITAGAIPPNPAELIESRAMIDLLTTLSERFDLVIVDSAPTTAVSDAIPLMRLVSGVVVVNRVDKLTRDTAKHLREHLANLNAPVLGVVANATSSHTRGYGYGYGYGAYSDVYVSDEPDKSRDGTAAGAGVATRLDDR